MSPTVGIVLQLAKLNYTGSPGSGGSVQYLSHLPFGVESSRLGWLKREECRMAASGTGDVGKKLRGIVNKKLIGKNGSGQRVSTASTLRTVVSNVLAHPGEVKYHKLRLRNKRIKREIVSPPGGMEYLLACGFVRATLEFEDHLVWPHTELTGDDAAPHLERLRLAVEILDERMAKLEEDAARAAAAADAAATEDARRLEAVRLDIAQDAALRAERAANRR